MHTGAMNTSEPRKNATHLAIPALLWFRVVQAHVQGAYALVWGASSASMKHLHNTHMLTSCCRLCGDTHCLSLFLTHTHTHTHTKDLSHDVEAPSHCTTGLGPLDHWIKSSTATGPLDQVQYSHWTTGYII